MVKTSISLEEDILKRIDDYRAERRPIPKMSESIRDLVLKGLVKKAITDLPKNAIKFEGKTVSIEKDRGRFVVRFNPSDLDILKNSGWAGSKVDVWISEVSNGIQTAELRERP